MQHPVMGAAETIVGEDAVGITDEVAIGEEKQLDQVIGAAPRWTGRGPGRFGFGAGLGCRTIAAPNFMVSLVDISQTEDYRSSTSSELNNFELARCGAAFDPCLRSARGAAGVRAVKHRIQGEVHVSHSFRPARWRDLVRRASSCRGRTPRFTYWPMGSTMVPAVFEGERPYDGVIYKCTEHT